MEERLATDHPAVIYLITSRGYIPSPPLEWVHDSWVEHTFEIPVNLYANGYFVTHPDGAVIYQSESEMTALAEGETRTVRVTLEDHEPDCPTCKLLNTIQQQEDQ